jgi:uncharacterized protein YjbJ (UPF0337 family)
MENNHNFSTQIEGNWHVVKGELKKRYGQLTDDDLSIIKGQVEKSLGTIQKKLGKTKEEFEKELKSFMN